MRKAISVTQLLNMKKEVFEFDGAWRDAFSTPERVGVWFVFGNSGNGKTSFTMQLVKYLAQWGKIAYNSLEEADSLTMQNAFRQHGMEDVKNNVVLLCEPIEELSERLLKKRSPDIVVIDSFQYAGLSYKAYQKFKELHSTKLIIFISHAEGKQPSGRAAKSVRYDAALKIWIEGYRAFSLGRYKGEADYYTIWEEGAERFWGDRALEM